MEEEMGFKKKDVIKVPNYLTLCMSKGELLEVGLARLGISFLP
jgi:hypothetical protein